MEFENWQDKQESFLRFLKEHQADEAPYRVDLDKQKIYWIDSFGLSLVVADCKVLLSYALSNNSVLMAWANSSLSPGSAADAVAGMREIYEEREPEDVWELALQVAESIGAEAIYRTPSPQSWVLLGLWNLRSGGAEQFTTGSPKNYVVRVVENLMDYDDLEERQVLLDNYAESFLQMATHPYKGGEFEKKLKDTARCFRNLLVFEDLNEQNIGLLKELLAWNKVED